MSDSNAAASPWQGAGAGAPSDSRTGDDSAFWWEQRWALLAFMLLATVPLLWPDIPPLVDLPGHMGRYRVQLDFAGSPELQQFYRFEWALIGNLGVDLLVIPLSKIVGLEMAVKLIVITIPPMTTAGSSGLRARCMAESRRPPCSPCPSSIIIRSSSAS